jgi:hypothetical protein
MGLMNAVVTAEEKKWFGGYDPRPDPGTMSPNIDGTVPTGRGMSHADYETQGLRPWQTDRTVPTGREEKTNGNPRPGGTTHPLTRDNVPGTGEKRQTTIKVPEGRHIP